MTLRLAPHPEEVVQRPTLMFDTADRYARDLGFRRSRPLGNIQYVLLGWIKGGARQDFPEPLQLQTVRNSSGYDLFYDQVFSPRLGPLRCDLPQNQTYVVRVSGELYQTLTVEDVPLPSNGIPYAVKLEPGYRYPFYAPGILPKSLAPTLVRGSAQDVDGSGISGALVSLTYKGIVYPYETDASGQWVIVLKPPTPLPFDADLRIDFPPLTIRRGGTVQIALVQADGTSRAHPSLVVPANQRTVNQPLRFN